MTMPFEQLEHVYAGLAAAIDRAGPDHEALFLAKLVLVLADRLGDVAEFEQSVATALQDLAGGAAAQT